MFRHRHYRPQKPFNQTCLLGLTSPIIPLYLNLNLISKRGENMLTQTQWILVVVIGFFIIYIYLGIYLLPYLKAKYRKNPKLKLDFRPEGRLYPIDNWSLVGLGKDIFIPMKIKPVKIDHEGKTIGLLVIQVPKRWTIMKLDFENDSMDPNGDGFSMFLSFVTSEGIEGEQRWHPDLRPTIYGCGPVYISKHPIITRL